ncbi:MAG: primase [Mucilaginibacter sp.]|nr:primase [Mucilaginibacter sp.]
MTLNCNQARQIPIVEYLAQCGINPEYIRGNNHWYLSPLREEKHASFKVDARLNAWYDHGSGEGGNLIDLGIRLHHCSVEELLARLSAGSYALSFHQPSAVPGELVTTELVRIAHDTDEPRIAVLEVAPLHGPSLIAYITGRGIDLTSARWYCREVKFSIKDKTYTAVGFENRSGGYELRNPWFKGSSSPKDITVISSHDNAQAVCLVEGFMDFLSLQRLRKFPDIPIDIIVLNSVALIGRSIELLGNYRDVYQYLNHDGAGQAAAEKLKLAGIQTIDASSFYQGHNDVNAYLLALQQHTIRQEIASQPHEKHGHGLRR